MVKGLTVVLVICVLMVSSVLVTESLASPSASACASSLAYATEFEEHVEQFDADAETVSYLARFASWQQWFDEHDDPPRLLQPTYDYWVEFLAFVEVEGFSLLPTARAALSEKLENLNHRYREGVTEARTTCPDLDDMLIMQMLYPYPE